jgi:beta-mannosidase
VAKLDPNRSYVSTSPEWGWGDQRSYTNGDSHYWGLWWGLEDWESFESKTGRFVSEYGMQSMPNYCTIKKYTDKKDRTINSPIIKAHQKANNGFEKLNHYINKYFYDTSGFYKLTLQEYTYLSQCMQYYILKNSIAIHRSKAPYNMGTMLWQLNDCWPVTSWSIIDYQLLPKAAYYGVKEAYRDDNIPTKDSIYPKNISLKKPNITIKILGNRMELSTDRFAKYVYVSLPEEDIYLSDNYFDLVPGKTKTIFLQKGEWKKNEKPQIMSLYDVLKKGKLQ